jgi:hypothetical protein
MIKKGKRKLYSVEDLKAILHLSRLTICLYIRKGKIMGGKKIGKSWYVTEENLNVFLEGEKI